MTFAAGVVSRSGVTNITSSTDATITGDGSTPIDAADIVGGLSTKTVTFAPGETTKNVSWEIVGDSAVEPNEGYKITLSNPSSPGGTYSTPVGRGTIMNDDNTAPAAIFPTASTADTGFITSGSVDEWVLTTTIDDTAYEIFYGCLDNDGSPGGSFKAINSTHITAYVRDSAGAEGEDNQMIYKDIPNVAGGVPLVVRYKRSTGTLTITINNVLVRSGGTTSPTGGAFLRFKTGGAARPAVTVTAA